MQKGLKEKEEWKLTLALDKTASHVQRHGHAHNTDQRLRSSPDDVEREATNDSDDEAPAVQDDVDLRLGSCVRYAC